MNRSVPRPRKHSCRVTFREDIQEQIKTRCRVIDKDICLLPGRPGAKDKTKVLIEFNSYLPML
jgi:hypothetical protein